MLFSYGTMRSTAVQLDTLGHVVTWEVDVLTGYTVDYLEIDDPRDDAPGINTHARMRSTGSSLDKVVGFVCEVSEAELDALDNYEAARGRRSEVTLDSGRVAWAYLPVSS
nr:gamma-glutamylcyclotransferase family protein [Microbacterium endophyticum]